MIVIDTFKGFGSDLSMFGILSTLGLTTNLKMCVDAADGNSYTGSGQQWSDRSGQGTHMSRGTTSGSEASDPTFNGSAGALTSGEYWSFDGADYFTGTLAVQSWMSNLHKDNAIWSMYAVYWYAAGNTQGPLLSTSSFSSGTGIEVGATTFKGVDDLQVRVFNAGASAYNLQKGSGPSVTAGWTSLGFSINEASASSAIRHEKGTNTTGLASTYTSPSASAADHTLHLAGVQDGAIPTASGNRLAIVAVWEGTALTSANFTAIHDAIKARYGW